MKEPLQKREPNRLSDWSRVIRGANKVNDEGDREFVEIDGTTGPVTVSEGIIVIDPSEMADGVTYIAPFKPGLNLGFCMIEGIIEMLPYSTGDEEQVKYVSE